MVSRSLAFAVAGQINRQRGNSTSAKILAKRKIRFFAITRPMPNHQRRRRPVRRYEQSRGKLQAAAGDLY